MKPATPTKELAGGCLALFGLPFLAAGLFITWWYFTGYTQWWRALGWQETACRIESADLRVNSNSDGTTYKATAIYQYEFGGQTYHGDRVSFDVGSDNIGGFQEQAHRELASYAGRHSAGAENDSWPDSGRFFRCYVNPANPSEAVIYRVFRWGKQALLALFALTFPAVGAGLVVAGIVGMRLLRREAALRAGYPGEPWKWKAAWTESSIPESTAFRKMALSGYTIWAGLVIVPLVLTAWRSGAFQQDRSAWLLMIFVALWAGLLWSSGKYLRHRLAVGATRFEPKQSPAWPGGELAGDILLEKPLPSRGAAEVRLFCEKCVTRGSGEDQRTTTEKVWSHQESVPQDAITRDALNFRIPVRFVLPADAPESESGADAATRHVWKLEFAVPGTPISAVYEVPVFRTANSPVLAGPASAAVPTLLGEALAELPALLAARRIRADFAADGTPLSLHCPPARNRSVIVFLILFDVIWTGMAVFLLKQHAPLLFCIVWPVSAAILWMVVIWNLLHQRTVTLSDTGMEVRNQLGPVVWTQVFDKARITGFGSGTNMSSGNQSFYRVWLTSSPGKNKTLVDNITEAATAGALVKRLETWLTGN